MNRCERAVREIPKLGQTQTTDPTLDEIVALCKRRGFVFQTSEIYGGLGSTYDYGHYGVLLRNNVKAEWWRAMLRDRRDIVAIDSAILQHPKTWEASSLLYFSLCILILFLMPIRYGDRLIIFSFIICFFLFITLSYVLCLYILRSVKLYYIVN